MSETRTQQLAELRKIRDETQQLLDKLDEMIAKYEAEDDNEDEQAYLEMRELRR